MGMFDNLYINPNLLPIEENEKEWITLNDPDWQTKDLENILTEVYITDEGELKINQWQYETVPKEERPYPNDEGIKGIMGSLKRKNEYLETLNYTGIVNFYSHIKKVWWEFNAYFENGKLIKITGGRENED